MRRHSVAEDQAAAGPIPRRRVLSTETIRGRTRSLRFAQDPSRSSVRGRDSPSLVRPKGGARSARRSYISDEGLNCGSMSSAMRSRTTRSASGSSEQGCGGGATSCKRTTRRGPRPHRAPARPGVASWKASTTRRVIWRGSRHEQEPSAAACPVLTVSQPDRPRQPSAYRGPCPDGDTGWRELHRVRAGARFPVSVGRFGSWIGEVAVFCRECDEREFGEQAGLTCPERITSCVDRAGPSETVSRS